MSIPTIKQKYGDEISANKNFISINGKCFNIDEYIDEQIFFSNGVSHRQLANNRSQEIKDPKELEHLYDIFNSYLEKEYRMIPPTETSKWDEDSLSWIEKTVSAKKQRSDDIFIFITGCVEEKLNDVLKKHNMKHRTAFRSAINCEAYSRYEGHPHKEFCGQFWDWSVRLWLAVRKWQSGVTEMPTKKDVYDIMNDVEFIQKSEG